MCERCFSRIEGTDYMLLWILKAAEQYFWVLNCIQEAPSGRHVRGRQRCSIEGMRCLWRTRAEESVRFRKHAVFVPRCVGMYDTEARSRTNLMPGHLPRY